jgi:hypothetical protein
MRLDKARFKYVIDGVIANASPLGHSSDVCWALWAAIVFKIKISRAAASALELFRDSAVGCLAMEIKRRGLVRKTKFDLSWIRSHCSMQTGLYEDQWLAVYEAERSGWSKTSLFSKDPCFGYLRAQDVRFFHEDHDEIMRKEIEGLRKMIKKSAPIDEDEDDTSDAEDNFDNYWLHKD